MSTAQFDVTAIGNAIVDVIAQADDAFLDKHKLPKGAMNLIDTETAERLYGDMDDRRGLCGDRRVASVVRARAQRRRARLVRRHRRRAPRRRRVLGVGYNSCPRRCLTTCPQCLHGGPHGVRAVTTA